ncbi:MAG: SIR2 family protein [Nitrospirota bacterium]|nr:SIR2 family protein [Nitrospirota bacterium]
MLDANNIETIRSLRLLFDLSKQESRKLVFWVGAGASSWCGYPRWKKLAERVHAEYTRYEAKYETKKGYSYLNKQRYPELFQICKTVSADRFYSCISNAFPPVELTPIYNRFIAALRGFNPTFILTTNIDELLEKQLQGVSTISRHDIQRAESMLRNDQSFVCKLHGSISDVRSTVFTTSDYKNLLSDPAYRTFLERMVASATVIFIGYGLQDDYVLSLMSRNWNIGYLFGDGPHFAILPHKHTTLPPSVRLIHYHPTPHKDHRAVIQVIEEMNFTKQQRENDTVVVQSNPDTKSPAQDISSAHLLFDVLPPGSWTTSQTLTITDSEGNNKQAITGTGYSDLEFPSNQSTAMHDIVVGLLCFDHVYAPLFSLRRVHDMLGSQRFWHLVENGVLSFIKWDFEPGIIFPSGDSIAGGDLANFTVSDPVKGKITVSSIIREHLSAVPGRESVAEGLFAMLNEKTREISLDEEGSTSDLVRSLLLRPSLRQLIGVSEGMPLNSITRWNTYPILRLANVVKLGVTCRLLKIGSVKLNFGAAGLAGPAFAATLGAEWADDTASYVLAGKFAANLGALVIQDPSILDKIIAFRETSSGKQLRKEVYSKLLANASADVSVAINSGLRSAMPNTVLQGARDDFIRLFIRTNNIQCCSTAIWNDVRFAENDLMRWRKRSRQILEEILQQRNLNKFDTCPCGSGEKIRDCCLKAIAK